MDIFVALQKHLILTPELVIEFGNRIYPLLLPQEPVLPAIAYFPMRCDYDEALQGQTGFVRQRIQLSIHARSFARARQLSRIVKESLQDFNGNMQGLTIQATHILTDISITKNNQTHYDIEEFVWILEYEFDYLEQG